jgi:DNA-directed RNA polymerase specialized sigma24 family protein
MPAPGVHDPRAADHVGDQSLGRLGDEDLQWLDVVARSMPRVRSYIRRVSKDDGEIADLLAETRLLAWVERGELLADPSPINVMIRHARKACREWMAVRRREVTLDEVMAATTTSQEAVNSGALSVGEAEEWQRWSQRVLGRLSTEQRLAVDYRYRWSWSYDFVAAGIGSTKTAARVYAYRAIQRLRRIVADDPPPLLASEEDGECTRRAVNEIAATVTKQGRSVL